MGPEEGFTFNAEKRDLRCRMKEAGGDSHYMKGQQRTQELPGKTMGYARKGGPTLVVALLVRGVSRSIDGANDYFLVFSKWLKALEYEGGSVILE